MSTVSSEVSVRRTESPLPLSSGAVLRPSASIPGLFVLRLRNDSMIPRVTDVRGWLDGIARDPSATRVRTAALFGHAAERFEQAGFRLVDTLVLMRADMSDPSLRSLVRRFDARRGGSMGTLRRHQHEAAAVIDRAAFGDDWGHDSVEFVEIFHATPVHRARCRYAPPSDSTPGGWRDWFGRPRSSLAGFAISGASADHGYLQRLSVAPSLQRKGHGRALTIDALRWMIGRRLPDCLVNTSIDNAPAQALYHAIGFTTTRDRLSVMQFDFQ